MEQLDEVARAEYGELVQATLSCTGSGQLTVIFVGDERDVYAGAGERVWPHLLRGSRRRRAG